MISSMNHSTQALLQSNTYANLATVSPDGQRGIRQCFLRMQMAQCIGGHQ